MFPFEFIINSISVSCPACNEVFATQINSTVPQMAIGLPVEADMHRILPYGTIRASLVTICPRCQYTWWTNTFNRHFYLPVGIPTAPEIDHAKKFAHAVLTGRKNNFHILDRALLALNGYWCAKENHQNTSKWLAFAIQELSAALADTKWEGSRERYHYLLGELFRLNSQFIEAVKEFALASSDIYLQTENSDTLKELTKNQKTLAQKQNNQPVLLTAEQVRKIFFPQLDLSILMQAAAENQEISKDMTNPTSDSDTTNNSDSTSNAETNVVDFGPVQSTTNNATLFPPKKNIPAQTKMKMTV